MKTPWQCRSCLTIEWRRSIKHDPKCSRCRRGMDPVTPGRCNVCGRELINEAEDTVGLCKACTG